MRPPLSATASSPSSSNSLFSEGVAAVDTQVPKSCPPLAHGAVGQGPVPICPTLVAAEKGATSPKVCHIPMGALL
ncbi:hypothetical protein SKAU_G00298910 [Synaphobranchus kaupii]|uniref:Uncharacterized protein n=1 Tax=Synaphobranchus kaupii TaxID=118154 RepID=A0A9Q1EVC5_SYNKA|nr:hypothetical protein SKAU_G00298910 [Synaphobranchus kaupii]